MPELFVAARLTDLEPSCGFDFFMTSRLFIVPLVYVYRYTRQPRMQEKYTGATVRSLQAQDSDRPKFQIAELTDTVVRSACRMAADWPAETALCLCVPFAPLTGPCFAARLLAVLHSTGLAPGRLIVEVPGSALVESFLVCSDNLSELQAAGVRIAVADLPGAVSPARWRTVTFDQIRIDRLDEAIASSSLLTKARSA